MVRASALFRLAARFAVIVPLAALLCGPSLALATPILGTAGSFGALAGSTVTNTGLTTINGNLGVWPSLAVTGFPPGTVNGTTYQGAGPAETAQHDARTAYIALAGLAPHGNVNSGILTGTNLGGLTLESGVYKFSSSAQLTGTLKLDANFSDSAYWVFQIGSALTTASASAVEMTNFLPDGEYGVFWQVGSSATLGLGTQFEGNIIADQSVTLTTEATIAHGSALALIAAVTLDNNSITPGFNLGLEIDENDRVVPIGGDLPLGTIPEPTTMLLLASGLIGIAARRRRARAR